MLLDNRRDIMLYKPSMLKLINGGRSSASYHHLMPYVCLIRPSPRPTCLPPLLDSIQDTFYFVLTITLSW